MLHRLSLRVLPQLNALVTDSPVRKRKRLVMLVPGLVAFGVYRLLKPVLPLSDPLVLLTFSGMLCAVTAIWSFQKGRGIKLLESIRKDGMARWTWLVGWVGVVYGVQLSLLVLALLQIFVNYDFLSHPEGPAMMAIIIACTSVTRDAFEIGYVQRLIGEGVPVPSFPDGKSFRQWVPQNIGKIGLWGLAGILASLTGSLVLYKLGPLELQPLVQSVGVPLIIACVSLMAFLDGQGHLMSRNREGESVRRINWMSALWFWVWPSFTFSATYFLVLWGLSVFVLGAVQVSERGFLLMAGLTAVMMATYTLYLGWRKSIEERTLNIPESVQRCPFVMGILQHSKNFASSREITDVPVSQRVQVNKR